MNLQDFMPNARPPVSPPLPPVVALRPTLSPAPWKSGTMAGQSGVPAEVPEVTCTPTLRGFWPCSPGVSAVRQPGGPAQAC